MTIKVLADKLGVSKEKIKYLYRQLPEHMYVMVGNRVILSDAAVDAITNRLNGGELTSDIPVPPYNVTDPVGWDGGEFEVNHSESGENISENGDEAPFTSDFTGETRLKNGDGENSESSEIGLTIIDHYNAVIAAQIEQLKAKDDQINRLTALISEAQSSAFEQLTAAQTAHADQLAARDTQIQRMQDTVDALTKQLADATERERQLQEAIEQSREEPSATHKWWMWWKR